MKEKEMKTLDDLMKGIDVPEDSKLSYEYENKVTNTKKALSHFGMEGSGYGEIISDAGLGSVRDSVGNYSLVMYDLCHDPSHNGGMRGCAYTSQVQLVDNKNKKQLVVDTYNYRGIGNCPFDHRNFFHEGKIMNVTDEKVLYAIKSHELIDFYEYDLKKGYKSRVDRVDLEEIEQANKQLEGFDKAFHELDEKSVKDFFDERYLFTNFKKLSDNYAILMHYDPYGDTGNRFAKTKLIVKDKGVFDLDHHSKKILTDTVTQGFDLENIAIKYVSGKLEVKYDIKESEDIEHSRGFNTKNLGKTSYKHTLDVKKHNLPVSKQLKLDSYLDDEKENLLAHQNLHPIAIGGVKEGASTPYSIDTIIDGDEVYVSTIETIDFERYENTDAQRFYDGQFRTTIYSVSGLDKDKPKLNKLTSHTSGRADYEGHFLSVDLERDKISFRKKPTFEKTEDGLVVKYIVQNFKDSSDKEVEVKF